MFYPLTGIVGLNNIKANDYLNVVLQVRMMVALNSLAPMIWFRILPTGCHTFLCLSTKRVKFPVKASLSIHISNVMEFVLSYFKFKELETHYLMESNLKECFTCIICLIINYCLWPCTIYYLLFMWFLFSSLIVALLCSNIWKNVISLKMHLITGSWTILFHSLFSPL